MKKQIRNDEPKLWVTVVKLIVGLVVIIGGVGLALWYAQGMGSGPGGTTSSDQWGISKDSPLRMKR